MAKRDGGRSGSPASIPNGKTNIGKTASKRASSQAGSSFLNQTTAATKRGAGKTTPATPDPPGLCFHCNIYMQLRMVNKVLQASKVLLKLNAPKVRVEKGINIARAIVLDMVDQVSSEHKKH
ncbi:unnamed protein product [Sphagnum balticum]